MRTNINDRIATAGRKLFYSFILVVGGVLGMSGFVMMTGSTVSDLVHSSHGLVGFAFGLFFMIGLGATNILVWILRGTGLMESLFFGDNES
jgi:hypothetical protein